MVGLSRSRDVQIGNVVSLNICALFGIGKVGLLDCEGGGGDQWGADEEKEERMSDHLGGFRFREFAWKYWSCGAAEMSECESRLLTRKEESM